LKPAGVCDLLRAVNTDIRTQPALNCPLCGAPGKFIYQQMRDRSYAAPGVWDLRECESCRAIWLHPQPVPADLGLAYQGYYTHHQPEPGASWVRSTVWSVWLSYLRLRFGYDQGVGARWKIIFAPLALLHPGGPDDLGAAAMYLPKPAAGARVLDVGCGSGVLLARMKSLGWEACGVEVDLNAVNAARERGLDIRHGQLAEINFPENHFDAVHLSHVIEHVYDPAALLRECRRVLKPGGALIVLTPNTASWGHRLFKSAWLNLDPPRHLILFNRRNFRSLAGAAGFKITRLDTSVHNAWVWGGLSRALERTSRAEMSELGRIGCLVGGAIFQLGERVRRWFDAEAGDEILLIARK
jgi:2-polyprenyl-3-methyl-5-hydroxy-6-metoxy-1,4-benzoquinol methylase